MAEVPETTILGLGIYTVPQAARLAGVPARSIRRWLFGYKYEYEGQTVKQPAVVRADQVARQLKIVTFQDLIELKFVHAFREHGVSWKTIRYSAGKACEITGSDHPFASRQFVTDGRTIFAEIAKSSRNTELLDLMLDQMAMRVVFLPSLRAKLEIDELGVRRLFPLGKSRPVVIDPARQFGQPISRDEGVPTIVLAKAAKAMDSMPAVARWYDVKLAAVRAAVEFEQRLAA